MRETAPQVRGRLRAAVGASWTATDWARSCAIATGVGVFLTFAGAFGTGGAPFPIRLAYWVGTMLGGTALSWAIHTPLSRLAMSKRRPWIMLGIGILIMSTLFTGVVWAVSTVLMGPGVRLPSPAAYFGPVLLVSVAMAALSLMAQRQPLETHAHGADAPAPRFLERLPGRLRGTELHAVQAEDHYLRLHTDRGSDLILMRLADAIAELDGLEGAQTHRSWWVAKQAVERARRSDGRAVLTLKSGVEAPVSRTYVRALREEGWF